MRKFLKSPVILIIILGILPLYSLFLPGLPLTHDGQDHVARIANFYRNLTEGVLIPRWAANLNWGYGHPVVMFLYPFPSYIASLFKAVGFTFVDSVKIVFGLSYLASLLFMYYWLRSWGGLYAGIVGAVVYGFMPYRFVDLYVRGAIGEHMAFVWPPAICYFIFRISKLMPDSIEPQILRKIIFNTAGLSLAVSFMILSHNALSLVFIPLTLFYSAYLIFSRKENKLLFLLIAAAGYAGGFGLAAFYWIPALFEGKYTLRDIVTADPITDRFVPFAQLLYSKWNYGISSQLPKDFGLVGWSALILGLAAFVKSKTYRPLISGAVTVIMATIFLMSPVSEIIWEKIVILKKFQFPWRLLSVNVFATAFIAGSAMAALTKIKSGDKGRFYIRAVVLMFAGMALLTAYMWQPRDYLFRNENFYNGIYESTTDTGESSPIWSVRFMEKVPAAPVSGITDSISYSVRERKTTIHRYEIIANRRTRVVENTLYFPDWQVRVNNKPVDIEFQDPDYRGLITFWVPQGKNQVAVVFGDTRMRTVANIISILSAVGVITGLTGFYLWTKSQKYR